MSQEYINMVQMLQRFMQSAPWSHCLTFFELGCMPSTREDSACHLQWQGYQKNQHFRLISIWKAGFWDAHTRHGNVSYLEHESLYLLQCAFPEERESRSLAAQILGLHHGWMFTSMESAGNLPSKSFLSSLHENVKTRHNIKQNRQCLKVPCLEIRAG